MSPDRANKLHTSADIATRSASSAKHGSELVSRFINMVMKSGKKSVAERIVYGAIDTDRQEDTATPIECLRRRWTTSRRAVEVKSRRVGGATYQVPVEVRPAPQALAMRWMIEAARASAARTRCRASSPRN